MIDEVSISKQYRENEQAFEKIRDELRGTLQNIAHAYFQKTSFQVKVLEPRLKALGSIIAKLKRKDISAESLFIKKDEQLSLVVNDFLGSRISCNTREDVEEIKKLICLHPRFKIVKIEDFNQNPKPSGYRAIHIDAQYRAYLNDDHIYIPVEIQIKTHLQNAWADISHDESYKPENEEMKNEWESTYSKHMADILDTLDDMASTIRRQRLEYVKPPRQIQDSDTLINPNTLSYKINLLKKGEQLTQQEMALVINRLKEEGYETLAEAGELLQNSEIETRIKAFKEGLRNNENVRPFEVLYYGSLLKRGKDSKFEDEMRKGYGFVQDRCHECNRWLTEDEFTFMKDKTDADTEFYCSDHRTQQFSKQCEKCGRLTSNTLCKNCDAETSQF